MNVDMMTIYNQVWNLIKDSLEPGDRSDVCRAISTAINVTIQAMTTEDKTEEHLPDNLDARVKNLVKDIKKAFKDNGLEYDACGDCISIYANDLDDDAYEMGSLQEIL